MDLDTAELGLNATPLVVGDVIVVGTAHRPGSVPRTMRNAKGTVRGYDVRTGKRLWIFHTIPRRGEFGYDTWLEGSAEYNGNTGVWAQMSADPELGLVYVPTEMPTGDYYGGNRPGDTLFADTLLALDVKTGRRKWHYQTVHHDVWDWDLPCAPILFDMRVGGRVVKAIAQPTKQAMLFVFNRETGEPIWPIEERPVPASDVPKERSSPTQPFPTKPAPFDRQGIGEDDLLDLTPALKAEALDVVKRYKMGPIFTPPVVSSLDGPLGRCRCRQMSAAPTGRAGRSTRTATFSTSTRTAPCTSTAWCRPLLDSPTWATSRDRRARAVADRAPEEPVARRALRARAAPAVGVPACRGCRSSSHRTIGSPPTT